MNVTTQVSVAGPAIAAIVNPDISNLSVIVLGLIAVVALIIDCINRGHTTESETTQSTSKTTPE
ncbi:MAG: hypothetical protein MIO92_15190 [Methanosarcinaceae archaeon]|nr:hypothetical protein [Methanosarcinaceae archaeon]